MPEVESVHSLFSVASQFEKLGIIGILFIMIGGAGWIIKRQFQTIEDLKDSKMEFDKMLTAHKAEVLHLINEDREERREFYNKIGDTLTRNTAALEKLEALTERQLEFQKVILEMKR